MTASTLSSWARNVNSSLEDEDDTLPSSPRLPSSAAVDSVLSSREARKRSVHMSSQDAWQKRDSESEPLQASSFRNASRGTTESLTSDQIKNNGRPVSLAHFMGADRTVQGPRLNKVQQASPTEYDRPMGSFMTQNPELMNNSRFNASRERVALPGLAKPSPASASSPSSPLIAPKPASPWSSSNEKQESLVAPKKSSTLPVADKSPKPYQSKPFTTSPATSPLIAPKPTFSRHDSATADSPKPDIMPKKSHTIPQVAPKPSFEPAPESFTGRTAETKPSWAGSPKPSYSPAQRTKSFEKAPTASLTKLKASNIVRDRLQWGEERAKDASPPVSAKSTPKRGNVMDRWGRDAPSSAPASPVVGQKKHFSLPVAATPASFTAPSSPAKEKETPTEEKPSLVSKTSQSALAHPTKDRARGPRKSTVRTTAVIPPAQPSPSTGSSDMTMKDFVAKQKANPPLPMPLYDEPSKPSKLDTLKATWQNQGPIGSRSLPTPPTRVSEEPVKTTFRNRVPLPGMTRPAPEPPVVEEKREIPFKAPTPHKEEFELPIEKEMNNDLLHWANQQVEDLPPPLSEDEGSSSDGQEAPEDLDRPRSSEPTMSELLREEDRKQTSQESEVDEDRTPSWASSTFRPKPKAVIEKSANRVSWIKPARAAPQPSSPTDVKEAGEDEMVLIPAFEPESFPSIDLKRLREETPRRDFGTSLSTDVILISNGSSRTLVEGDKSIFYDSELLLIVHRAKKNGLATSHLYLWRGGTYTPSDADQSKVDELASRYRSDPIEVHHGEEMPDFYTLLGSRMITRTGSRKGYDGMNTCLYRVRGTREETVLIDEVPLASSSVCSAFSFVLGFAGSFVVWHGRSAAAAEQIAARSYVEELAQGSRVSEERESGEQQGLFWQIVGTDEYSSSILWRRKQGLLQHPKIYSVEAHASTHICPVTSISESSISMIDTSLELWVIVPKAARADRHNINFALTLAKNLSTTASSRQPVFVLICPSLIPIDLQSALRVTNWQHMNGDLQQDKLQMNVLSLEEAEEQLKARSLPRAMFSDTTCLPLGFDAVP